MRKYKDQEKKILCRAYCNCCGRELKIKQGILLEGVLHVEKDWGFFSGRDMEHHAFDLCESCYDKITEQFCIPPEKSEVLEV